MLHEIPELAEKHSRQLVPLFLSWAVRTDASADDDESLRSATETPEPSSQWDEKDQKAMLALFGRFTNPRALYRAEDVKKALMKLLTSGDASVQRLALNAIFTWKSSCIRPYQENLTRLLDDARFRDEVTSFVQVEEDQTSIEDSHRAELMPVLLRILYGRSLSKKGIASGKRGMEARRTVILGSLANFREEEIHVFIKIALGDLYEAKIMENNGGVLRLNEAVFEKSILAPRKTTRTRQDDGGHDQATGGKIGSFCPRVAGGPHVLPHRRHEDARQDCQ